MQLSLLGNEQPGTEREEMPRGIVLRDYQAAIAEQALSYLSQGRNPLSVAATGTGKTRIAADVVRRFPGRVLWIAHRIELVKQGIEALEHQLGERVDSEAVGRYSGDCRVVVASKDTARTAKRLERLRSFDAFELIVIDEAHHSAASSYWSIINAYPGALRYGLTATPGRLDKRPLAAFDCMTDPFGIVEASQAGWLVPIRAKRKRIESVDLSGVKTVAGDFDQSELDAVMKSEANLHAVAQAVLERIDHGPCLLFATSVDVAERQAEVLCRYRPGVAKSVSGKTPGLERAGIFAGLGRSYQVLVNVGVATEGTDLPRVATVAMGRPTKSTALFQQMLGRGLRPLPGVVDGAEDRHAAIRNSSKPFCLVLDFVGSTGRHSVATAIDALDVTGECEQAAAKKVKERIEAGEEIDLAGALAEEIANEQERKVKRDARKKREEAKRLALVASVELTETDVRLIGLGGEIAETERARTLLDGPPLPGQVAELKRLGCTFDGIETARAAKARIEQARKEQDYASPKVLEMIRKHRPELYRPDLKRGKAGWIVSQIMKRWR